MVDEEIRLLFDKYPDVLYGYSKIDYGIYKNEYKSALVFAVPHKGQLTLKTYSENKFEDGIIQARIIVDEIIPQIESILKDYSIKYYVPPVAQNNEEELLASFSFKYAAVNAGFGWIGKNDVVITKKYGPRIRLSAILINYKFDYGKKITESHCPEDCNKCIDICPHKALKNTIWNIEKLRSEIIDYNLCNEKRSEYIKDHGRKNACGLCLAICPFGQI